MNERRQLAALAVTMATAATLLPLVGCHQPAMMGRGAEQGLAPRDVHLREGGIVRGPTASRRLAIVFTGHSYEEGGKVILKELGRHKAQASFFFTGVFLTNVSFKSLVRRIVREGHYLGPHSDKHLLYCPWEGPREPGKYPLSRWVGFISVTDVQAAAALTEKDGGKVTVSARKAGDRGTEALLMDPEGGIFGVINSATGDPEDYLAGDGQWLWAELWAGDAEKMAAFYKGIGPYEVRGGAASGETTGFQLWSGGYARAGILPRPAKVPTTWLPYVRVQSVTDTVARASEAGGKVVMPPAQVHGTSVAVILDPTGAPFAVAEWPAVAREAAR